MQAIILDTETATLNGVPIQIAYTPCTFVHGKVETSEAAIFDEYFSTDGEAISFGSMAVHHIIESDLAGKPSYKTFRLPEGVQYMIGHNIAYDMQAIAKCGINLGKIKPICTLALSRAAFPEADAHNLTAMIYRLTRDKRDAREMLTNAHNAKVDITNTARLLQFLAKKLNCDSLERLYLASQDALIPRYMPFGKYRGWAIVELPDDYVEWLLRQDDLDEHLRRAFEKL